MKIKKTLSGILLAGILTLLGCKNYSLPYYNGKIGEDSVYSARETAHIADGWFSRNYLEVRKQDGRKVEFLDFNKDLRLDKVVKSENGISAYYDNTDAYGRMVLEKSQRDFEYYLTMIEWKKMNLYDRGLEN